MKVALQTTVERKHLANLIDGISVAMLTTFDSHGALTSCPMSPLELCEQGAIWFLTNANSSKAQYLRVVNLSFSDESNGVYVSLSGYGEIVNDKAHVECLWTPFARPWFPDGAESNDLALLKFMPESAEYWDAQHSKMVHMFAMAASMIVKKPIGLGEHGSLTHLQQP